MNVVLLVEGESDRAALETVAVRRGRDLSGEGVSIVVMRGATNVGHHLAQLVGTGVAVGGLYDAAEQHYVRRGLERVGLRAEGSPAPLHEQGFFMCVSDLEDEFLQALGEDGVLAVVEAAGELDSFHLLQQQPSQRERPLTAQLRRFLGVRSGRKARYGHLLAEAVPLPRVPQPLDGILEWARDAPISSSRPGPPGRRLSP